MSVPTIFDLCDPRTDVLAGTSSDSDFAADLSHVVRGSGAPNEYSNPERFFANTYPTRGLKGLLSNVCSRLSGQSGAVSAIFRLDTSFGGGKTHGLIALVHAARGMKGVSHPDEFIDPVLIPSGEVRIATFDGENADPANGRRMEGGILAYTPWGEIACALAGTAGYERIRRSDEQGIAPGAETIAELFGDQPALILLDEMSVYLRKMKGKANARDQLTAFLTSLFKAVESSPRAALVYTLAIGKDGMAADAYSDENQFIADRMAEAESVSARKATLLNPTEDDETVQVLRRRLFSRIDDAKAAQVIGGDGMSYRSVWHRNRDALSPEASRPDTLSEFRSSYPLHPDVLATFTGKTATLANFQRVRGMLRILGRTVHRLWQTRPGDATAIHLHHIDPGFEPIRQEIVTRLQQTIYVPALRNDIAGEQGKRSLAQEIDEDNFKGMPPYTTYVARTVFMHTLAFNDQLKGLTPEHLRYATVAPFIDISFIDDARQKFIAESAYLDDRPGAPMRFLAEANLTQIIRRAEQAVDAGDLRAQVNDRIKEIFKGAKETTLGSVIFPGGPWDVPDEVGDGRPLLVVLFYDACSVGVTVNAIPDLVASIYQHKGAEAKSVRALRNNLIFVVADQDKVEDMRSKMARRIALQHLKTPLRLNELAEHQRETIREQEARSEADVAISVQQCYRHLFYPSRNRMADATIDIAHSALDIHSASEKPGSGQQQIVRALREYNKLRTAENAPDAPAYTRDNITALKNGQITTAVMRNEFRRDPRLPMLVGDEVFIKGIRQGIEGSEYVYRRVDLVYGHGDPLTSIAIDEQAVVFTMSYAKEHGIWPRATPKPLSVPETPSAPVPAPDDSPVLHGGSSGGDRPDRLSEDPLPPPTDIDGVPKPTTPPKPAEFTAEGVLRQALVELWEKVRAKKTKKLGMVSIRPFDTADAFRLLGVVKALRNCDKKMIISGEYETKGGSTFNVSFVGNLEDAQPVKDFLEPQLRATDDKIVTVIYELSFATGLLVQGDDLEKVTEQLTKFAIGAAYVEAKAEEMQ